MWWHMVTHGRGSEGGNWWMEWVASTLHTTSEHGASNITTADARTSVASSRLNWRPPADLNGLVRFAERRNLVAVRVPSHFSWPLLLVAHLYEVHYYHVWRWISNLLNFKNCFSSLYRHCQWKGWQQQLLVMTQSIQSLSWCYNWVNCFLWLISFQQQRLSWRCYRRYFSISQSMWFIFSEKRFLLSAITGTE